MNAIQRRSYRVHLFLILALSLSFFAASWYPAKAQEFASATTASSQYSPTLLNAPRQGARPVKLNNHGDRLWDYLNFGVRASWLERNGEFWELRDPSGTQAGIGMELNDDGDVVGYYYDSVHGPHALLWRGQTRSIVDIGALLESDFGYRTSVVTDINSAGIVVGVVAQQVSNSYALFTWSENAGFVFYPAPLNSKWAGNFFSPTDPQIPRINLAGKIVASLTDLSNPDSVLTLLLPASTVASYIQYDLTALSGFNDLDQAIGFLPPGSLQQAALATSALTRDLDSECGAPKKSFAYGINNGGLVVGTCSSQATIWDSTGAAFLKFRTTGVELPKASALDINDLGQIVVAAYPGDGQLQAYLLSPVETPPPSVTPTSPPGDGAPLPPEVSTTLRQQVNQLLRQSKQAYRFSRKSTSRAMGRLRKLSRELAAGLRTLNLAFDQEQQLNQLSVPALSKVEIQRARRQLSHRSWKQVFIMVSKWRKSFAP